MVFSSSVYALRMVGGMLTKASCILLFWWLPFLLCFPIPFPAPPPPPISLRIPVQIDNFLPYGCTVTALDTNIISLLRSL